MNIVCPWITPKIFADFDNPAPRVREFFDHYARWFCRADQVVLNFCTGNGDHILNYAGRDHWDDSFDWARYNCYQGNHDAVRLAHNRAWTEKCREGGERSGNPYCAGPSFILSQQVMTYHKLHRIYDALRTEAAARKLNFKLLEYLEPGPEMCASDWKTSRHPEGSPGRADAGGVMLPGVLDVCASLRADRHVYAAYPSGIPEGTIVGDFVAAQCDAFTRDLTIDGVFLGNQFGLLGFWLPENAPSVTQERRDGIARFFKTLRKRLGDRLVYWMDTYWPADVEIERWAMNEENYAQLDAIMISNFAVIIEKRNIIPNLESRLSIAGKYGGRPLTLFSFDFVDCWYAYRVYLDQRWAFEYQHEVYRKHGARLQGASFFANDTFGHFVYPKPLEETLAVIRQTHGWD